MKNEQEDDINKYIQGSGAVKVKQWTDYQALGQGPVSRAAPAWPGVMAAITAAAASRIPLGRQQQSELYRLADRSLL